MEKERKIKVLSIVALIIAVLGLTVAFAALSQTLTINGTSKVEKNDDGQGNKRWEVRFYGVSSDGSIDESATTVKPVITGDATAVDATLSDTTISIIKTGGDGVVLKKPGDKVVYSFYVKNNGSIDAKLGTVSKNLGCQTNNENDKVFCNNNEILATLAYDDGNSINEEDELEHTGSRKINLTFEFSNEATSLPTDDITLFNAPIVLTYVQD